MQDKGDLRCAVISYTLFTYRYCIKIEVEIGRKNPPLYLYKYIWSCELTSIAHGLNPSYDAVKWIWGTNPNLRYELDNFRKFPGHIEQGPTTPSFVIEILLS